MQGKEIDMEALRTRNELAIAIGNGKMNARGDKLGPGGKVHQKRDEVVAEYYDTNPKSMQNRAPIADTPVSQPTPSVEIQPEVTPAPQSVITEGKKKV